MSVLVLSKQIVVAGVCQKRPMLHKKRSTPIKRDLQNRHTTISCRPWACLSYPRRSSSLKYVCKETYITHQRPTVERRLARQNHARLLGRLFLIDIGLFWYKSSLFWNNTSLFWHDLSDQKRGCFDWYGSLYVCAIDWCGSLLMIDTGLCYWLIQVSVFDTVLPYLLKVS